MCDSTSWVDLHNQSLSMPELQEAALGLGMVKPCGQQCPADVALQVLARTASLGTYTWCSAEPWRHLLDVTAVMMSSGGGILRGLWCSWGTSRLCVGGIHPDQLELLTKLVSRVPYPDVYGFLCYKVFLLCKSSHVPAGNLSFPEAFQVIVLSIAKRWKSPKWKIFPFYSY